MSRPVRLMLLLGCALIVLLEAPEARSSLAAGLAGPYASPAPPPAVHAARAPQSPQPVAAALAPVLFVLSAPTSTAVPALAVGR